jgi:hypothetical protein
MATSIIYHLTDNLNSKSPIWLMNGEIQTFFEEVEMPGLTAELTTKID